MAEPATEHDQKHFETTRTSRAWWTLGGGLLVLLLAIVFMAQNGSDVPIHFLFFKGHIALGLALLLAAVLGGLTVLLLGAARMLQMRRQAKRAHKAGASAD
ncbi:MAG: hypothetical protein JWP02_3510 [Acidimicrobiales bacterium]|nr:hypothetical protein [Acidimicrobiales bacterium]